jgi:hypothetical protein
MILKLIFAIVLVEAITNLLTKSEFFLPVRKFFFKRNENKFFGWLHDLLDCGYCTSVWIGWFIALFLIFGGLYNFFFIGIFLHRMANLFHHFIDMIWGED